MKKSICVLLTVLLVALCCAATTACGGQGSFGGVSGNVDYGTLSVENVVLVVGDEVKISYRFSIAERAEQINYSFEGDYIKIENGKVKALAGEKTITVTAKTEHHETTFTVTTFSADNGSIVIDDVTAWIGYPASELKVVFEYEEGAADLEYSYDETKIEIDASKNTVKALAEGVVEVTATRPFDNYSTTFKVYAQTVDRTSDFYDTSNYNNKVAGYKDLWEQNGVSGSTTLFIGDSFFDSNYWTDFYDVYAGKDVIRAGVASSTTCDWEVFADAFLKYTNPKNIVMHIGTNNVYDDNMNAEQTINALQRMFYVIHDRVPAANIYYFNISQRSYDEDKQAIVAAVNNKMASWCESKSWITIIDSSSKLTKDMLKDNTHPKLECYYVFTDALAQTDIVINDLAE